MLTGIRTRNPIEKEETPADLLLGCHERIRHFTAMGRRLAESPNASPEEVYSAAEAVHRYFSVALPLHEADENVSIDPRLHAAVPPGEIAQACEDMVLQHRDINAVLRQLLPLWDALCREPEKLPSFAPRLLQLSSQLEGLWDIHLRLEEEVVFPAMQKYLASQEMEAILSEMRERRR